MSAPITSSLSEFVDAYHLWSVVIAFVLLGVYHALDLGLLLCFRFLGDVNEAYYHYKTRCVENQRRHEQFANEPVRALAQRAGAD
jgi:hypothetical protein